MTSGTKIILAVITLFVGILVVYYGFVMPGADDPLAVQDETSEMQGESAGDRANDDETASRARAAERTSPPNDRRSAAPLRPPSETRTNDTATARRDPAPNRTVPPPAARSTTADTPVLPRDTTRLPAVATTPDSIASKPAGAPALGTPPASEASPGTLGAETRPPDPVTRTATRTETPPARPERRERVLYTMYTVKDGDTLTSIAQRWFGDHRKWDLIAKANPIDPNRLKIGQRLRLPPKDASPEPVERPTETKRVKYEVRAGDSLSTIADAHYGDAALWAHLYAVNRAVIGTDPDTLAVGMKLVIPAAPAKKSN